MEEAGFCKIKPDGMGYMCLRCGCVFSEQTYRENNHKCPNCRAEEELL